MTNTPKFLPVLSYGGHSDPMQGACFMEYASFLAGEEFTDDPVTTDSNLSLAMRQINDAIGDDMRNQLAPLIPMVLNTNGKLSGVASDQWYYDLGRWVVGDVFSEEQRKDFVADQCSCGDCENRYDLETILNYLDSAQHLQVAKHAVTTFRSRAGMSVIEDVREQLAKATELTGQKVAVTL